MSGGVRGAVGGGARSSAPLPGGVAVAESNRGARGNGCTGSAWGGERAAFRGEPGLTGPQRVLRPRRRCRQVAERREGGEAPHHGCPVLPPTPGELGPGAAEGPRGAGGQAAPFVGPLLSSALCRSFRSPFFFLVEVLCSISPKVSFSERLGALSVRAVPAQKLALHFNAVLSLEVKSAGCSCGVPRVREGMGLSVWGSGQWLHVWVRNCLDFRYCRNCRHQSCKKARKVCASVK